MEVKLKIKKRLKDLEEKTLANFIKHSLKHLASQTSKSPHDSGENRKQEVVRDSMRPNDG